MNENQKKLVDEAREILGRLILAAPEEPFDIEKLGDALRALWAAQEEELSDNKQALVSRSATIVKWLYYNADPTLEEANAMFAALKHPLGPYDGRKNKTPRQLCLVIAALQLGVALGRYVI